MGKPDLRECEKYRQSLLPRRVQDPSSALGFRRARPGEKTDAEGNPTSPYPLFTKRLFEHLDSFGVGVSLYFRQLAFLFVVALVCALVLASSTAHNARACKNGDVVKSTWNGGDMENSGLARGTAAGCLVDDLKIGANIAPDIAVCVIILLAALAATYFRSGAAKRIEENMQTPADYTIVVRNPPAHVVDPDAYKTFFAGQWNDDVVAVTMGKDNGELMSLLAARKGFLRDLQDFEERGQDDDDLNAVAALAQPFVYSLGLLKTPAYAKANLEATEAKIKEKVEQSSGGDWHKPKTVYVTFNTEASMDRALQTFEVSAARRWFSNATGIEFQNTPLAFEGTVLDVARPVEPSELLWHNSHVKFGERVLRMAVCYGVTLALLAAFIFIARALAKSGAQFALAFFVTIVNTMLPLTLKTLSDLVEKHLDYGNAQESMFLKLMGARWTNTAIAVFVSYNSKTRLSGPALEQVMLILLFDAFLMPLVRVFEPYDLFMRFVVAARQPTQTAANRFWVGADWNIAERYTDVAKTLFVGMFYAAAVPNGLLVTAAALATTFFADRYCLLRTWARKPDFDDQLSRRTVGVVSIIVFIHVAAALDSFQNWGLYPRDALEAPFDEDPLYGQVLGTPSNCWGRGAFLNCQKKDSDKELTSAQKFANSVYPPLGWIALAVALWRFVGVELLNLWWFLCCGETQHDADTMPITFRALGESVSCYVPVVPHPIQGEPDLIAADVAGVPDHLLPLPPYADVNEHTVCSRRALRALLPASMDDAKLDQVLADVFGKVVYYEPPPVDRADVCRPSEPPVKETAPLRAPEPKRPAPQPVPTPETEMAPRTMPLPAPPRAAPLPPGWEKKMTPEGKPYYVDHTTQRTSWTPPPAPQ
mmetsp:Transcript_29345/g.87781  ORF Transcript_29345/g.87781 Transcript_29345/m.87781 type:complete len:877 (+) Transcript_29345:146-2776(+)